MLTQGKPDNHVGRLGLLRSIQLPFVSKKRVLNSRFMKMGKLRAPLSKLISPSNLNHVNNAVNLKINHCVNWLLFITTYM